MKEKIINYIEKLEENYRITCEQKNQYISTLEQGLNNTEQEIERLNNIIKRFEEDLREVYLTFGEFSEEYTEKKIRELKGIEKERKYWLCERTDCCGRIKDSKKYSSLYQENKRLNNKLKDIKSQLDYLETYSSKEDVFEDMKRRLDRIDKIIGSDKE